MSILYTLFVVACVGPVCHYVASPVSYATQEGCQINAAMIAGMKRAESAPVHDPRFSYRFECTAQQQMAEAAGLPPPAKKLP